MSDTCSSASTLAPSGSCAFQARFTAVVPLAERSAAFTYACQVGGSTTVTLGGTGVPNQILSVSAPSTVSFGTRLVGISTSTTFTLRNGDPSTPATSLAVGTGSVAAPWSVASNTCGPSLPAGAACSVTLIYQPSATPGSEQTGTSSGGVSVGSAESDPDDPGYSATAVTIQASTATVAFGNVPTTEARDSVAIEFTNPSNMDDASGCAVSVGAPFSIIASTCGTTIARSGSCGLAVRLPAHGSAASLNANLDLVCSVGGRARVPVTATTVVIPSVTWDEPGGFGNVDTGLTFTKTFTLRNNDAAVGLTNLSVGLASGSSNRFSITGGTCGATLAASATCTVDVAFSPSVTGALVATLRAVSTNESASVDLALTGTGTTMILTSSLTSLTFNTREVGQAGTQALSVTLTNSGTRTANLAYTLPTNPSNIYVLPGTGTCAATLGAGLSCTLAVRYAAHTSAATHAGVMRIAEAASATVAGTTINVSLSAETIAAPLIELTDDRGNSVNAATIATTDITGAVGHANNIVDLSPAYREATITVRNSGGASLNSLQICIDGDCDGTAGTLTIQDASSCTGSALAAGATCTFKARFTPTDYTDVTETLTVTGTSSVSASTVTGTITNLVGNSYRSANLTWNAGATYSLGPTDVGATADTAIITITNGGDLTATSFARTGSAAIFTAVNSANPGTACGATLAGGASCELMIRFSPTVAGAFTGTLTASYAGGADLSTSLKAASAADGHTGLANINDGIEADVAADSDRVYFVSRNGAEGGTNFNLVIAACTRDATTGSVTNTCDRVALTSANNKLAGDTIGSGPKIALQGTKVIVAFQDKSSDAAGTAAVYVCDKPTTGNQVSGCTKTTINSTSGSGSYPSLQVTNSKLIMGNTGADSLAVISICNYSTGTLSACINNTIHPSEYGYYTSVYYDGTRVFATASDPILDDELWAYVCIFPGATNAITCNISSAAVDGANAGLYSSLQVAGNYMYIAHHAVTSNSRLRLSVCPINNGANAVTAACVNQQVSATNGTGLNPRLIINGANLWISHGTYATATNLNSAAKASVWKCAISAATASCDASAYYTQTTSGGSGELYTRSLYYDSTRKIFLLQYERTAANGTDRLMGHLSLGALPEL